MVLILAGFLPAVFSDAASVEADDVPAKIQIATVLGTVRITNPATGTEGSGVMVGKKDGDVFILTASHLLEGTRQARVAPFTAKSYPESAATYETNAIPARDKLRDLAIIRISVKGGTHSLLPLCSRMRIPTGKNFTGLITGCNPGKPPLRRTINVIGKKRVRRPGNKPTWAWELSATQPTGWSGGALVNSEGKLIGIASGSNDGKGYYVHAAEIHSFLDEHSLSWLCEKAEN